MKQIKRLLSISLIPLSLVACAAERQEGVVANIQSNNKESLVTIMNDEGELKTYQIDNKNIGQLKEGDKVKVETHDQSIKQLEINNYTDETELTDVYKKVSDYFGGSDYVVLMDVNDFIESYEMEVDDVVDGVVILPKAENDIRTAIIIESNDPVQFQTLFNEIADGLKATYESNEELLTIISQAYFKYANGFAVLLVGDEAMKQDVLSIMEGYERWN